MTVPLFREDAYLVECQARVVEATEGAIVLDQTVFYPTGGGQPGDTGTISWDGGRVSISDTRKGQGDAIRHMLEDGDKLPEAGTTVTATINWEPRYRHMRMHTAMHLLGSVIPHGVTGGNIAAAKSRLDFDMQESVDKDQVNAELAALVAANHPIRSKWISDEELEAQPELIRTLSVRPPKGAGMIRLLEIESVDLQPCGGTHLKSTGEVGRVRLSKVENKGRHNRRMHIVLED